MYQFIISLDNIVSSFFVSHASPLLGEITKRFTSLADTDVLVCVIIIVGIISLVRRDRRFADIVAVTAVSSVVIDFMKNYVGRHRPSQVLYSYGHYGYSFPSGHTIFGVVVYGLIGYWCVCACRKKWQKISISILTVLLVAAIGFSRVVLNVHWFSDVVEGWIVGGAILFFATQFHKFPPLWDNGRLKGNK